MIVVIEKPGSPEELVEVLALEHYGIPGMKWGHRKENSRHPKTSAQLASQKAHRRKIAKRVAIGAGTVAVVAGAGYVAYKLHKNGNLPFSHVKKTSRSEAVVKKILTASHLKKVPKSENVVKKIGGSGAAHVRSLLGEHGAKKTSELDLSTVEAGKQHLTTLYTKWVDVQVNPLIPEGVGPPGLTRLVPTVPNLLGTILDFTK